MACSEIQKTLCKGGRAWKRSGILRFGAAEFLGFAAALFGTSFKEHEIGLAAEAADVEALKGILFALMKTEAGGMTENQDRKTDAIILPEKERESGYLDDWI